MTDLLAIDGMVQVEIDRQIIAKQNPVKIDVKKLYNQKLKNTFSFTYEQILKRLTQQLNNNDLSYDCKFKWLNYNTVEIFPTDSAKKQALSIGRQLELKLNEQLNRKDLLIWFDPMHNELIVTKFFLSKHNRQLDEIHKWQIHTYIMPDTHEYWFSFFDDGGHGYRQDIYKLQSTEFDAFMSTLQVIKTDIETIIRTKDITDDQK